MEPIESSSDIFLFIALSVLVMVWFSESEICGFEKSDKLEVQTFENSAGDIANTDLQLFYFSSTWTDLILGITEILLLYAAVRQALTIQDYGAVYRLIRPSTTLKEFIYRLKCLSTRATHYRNIDMMRQRRGCNTQDELGSWNRARQTLQQRVDRLMQAIAWLELQLEALADLCSTHLGYTLRDVRKGLMVDIIFTDEAKFTVSLSDTKNPGTRLTQRAVVMDVYRQMMRIAVIRHLLWPMATISWAVYHNLIIGQMLLLNLDAQTRNFVIDFTNSFYAVCRAQGLVSFDTRGFWDYFITNAPWYASYNPRVWVGGTLFMMRSILFIARFIFRRGA